MFKFFTYLHAHIFLTTKPVEEIKFTGQSLPHYNTVRAKLADELVDYPTIPPIRVALDEYARVHDPVYLDTLQQMARGEEVEAVPKLSLECAGLEYNILGYEYALGGMFEAINRMREGVLERAYCFSMGGHHAYQNWGHGYCLLNPLAAAARYAQEQGFEKVLIIDWDHHHGDGTQSIFANDKSVYCLSIHSALDLYMSTQRVMRQGTTTAAEQVGHGNIPILSREFDDDVWEQLGLEGAFYRGEDSLAIFQTSLEKLPWTPNIILIFSGYDAHVADCGRGIQGWVNDDFEQLTVYVLELAQKAKCPILSVHGGGYNVPVTVSAALVHVNRLARGL